MLGVHLMHVYMIVRTCHTSFGFLYVLLTGRIRLMVRGREHLVYGTAFSACTHGLSTVSTLVRLYGCRCMYDVGSPCHMCT